MNSHEMHSFYMELHDMSRNYKGKVKHFNILRQKQGKTPLERQTVEMDNFQDPQVNTLWFFVLTILMIVI